MTADNLLICAPCGSGMRRNENAYELLQATRQASGWHGVHVDAVQSSLLAWSFNESWCRALNYRDQFSHFLLWHDDIVPVGATWLRDMKVEMERAGAHVLSVMMPIKENEHVRDMSRCRVSVAMENPDDEWDPHVFTMGDMGMDTTITSNDHPGLLFNSGLMLVDLRWSGVEKCYFTIHDKIRQVDGQWQPCCQPEDYNFSRMVAAAGGLAAVTRRIRAFHIGSYPYANWVEHD